MYCSNTIRWKAILVENNILYIFPKRTYCKILWAVDFDIPVYFSIVLTNMLCFTATAANTDWDPSSSPKLRSIAWSSLVNLIEPEDWISYKMDIHEIFLPLVVLTNVLWIELNLSTLQISLTIIIHSTNCTFSIL